VYFVDAEDSVETMDSVYAVNSEMLQELIRVSPVAFELS